jgi:PHD/YefM family antitoxin component YafN of YafNO toxin-antitoxin module
MVASNLKTSRGTLDDVMDRMIDANGAVIIKRPGKRDLALIPAEKLGDIDTTAYLLASPKNRRRLLTALRQSRAGRGKRMTVEQLRRSVGL